MGVHWGVDSWNKATGKVPGRNQIFWAWVCATYKRAPEFWGRYILGGGGPPLDDPEVQFLLSKGCRILPIVRPNPAKMAVTGLKGVANGMEAANNTLAAAKNLSIPSSVYIYLDIESGDKPSEDWISGLFTNMSPRVPGFYCSPTNPNFHVPYCKALNRIANKDAPRRLWSVTPYQGCQASPTDFKADSPKCDPGAGGVVQYAIGCHGNLIDLDLANDDGFNSMWGR
jgi:hypothetical protein